MKVDESQFDPLHAVMVVLASIFPHHQRSVHHVLVSLDGISE